MRHLIPAQVAVRGYGAELEGTLLELSRSGLCVRLAAEVPFPLGAPVDVALRMDGLPELELAGWVARHLEPEAASGGCALAIAFDSLSMDAQQLLERCLAACVS